MLNVPNQLEKSEIDRRMKEERDAKERGEVVRCLMIAPESFIKTVSQREDAIDQRQAYGAQVITMNARQRQSSQKNLKKHLKVMEQENKGPGVMVA